jgi:hypothetical protein
MEFQIYNDDDKEQFISVLNAMRCPIKGKLDNIYDNRSIPQNKYYHLIKKQLAEHLGETPPEMHKILLKEFALIEEKVVNGEVEYIVESTSGMDTLRMEKFLEDIRRWALTIHGFYIAMPNEIFDEYENQLKQKVIK